MSLLDKDESEGDHPPKFDTLPYSINMINMRLPGH